MRDNDGYELETYKRVWFIEIGWCDGGGVGYWEDTQESIPMQSYEDCVKLRDHWVETGKIKKMQWGDDYRPVNIGYGLFRIRSELQRVS